MILLVTMEWGIPIISKWTLDEFISQHNKVLILFYSDTCSKCHFWIKNLTSLADERDEDWEPFVIAYNAWEDIDICNKLNISSVPMLIAFEDWEEIWRLDEIQPNDFIKNYFKRNDWDNLSVRINIESEKA